MASKIEDDCSVVAVATWSVSLGRSMMMTMTMTIGSHWESLHVGVDFGTLYNALFVLREMDGCP